MAIGLIGFLISKIPEHVLFAILDFFAVIIRTIVAIVTAIYTCIKNTSDLFTALLFGSMVGGK